MLNKYFGKQKRRQNANYDEIREALECFSGLAVRTFMMKKPGYVRRGYYILEKNVPFQSLLPLKLKTSVSGKGDNSATASCVQEMSVLFACLKRNNFNETPCTKEVTEFKKCWTEHATRHRQNKVREKEGELTPGESKLSHKQLSALLKQFP